MDTSKKKKTSIAFTAEKAKRFVMNFVKAFHPDAKLCFYVHNTSLRNVYDIRLEIHKKMFIVQTTYYNAFVHASLDPIFSKAHPDIMLRPNQIVTVEDLVTKYGLDENAVMKSILQGIRRAYCASYSGKNAFVAKCISVMECLEIPLKETNSFEEFAVAIDLA